jgi:hypothetical protein
MIISSSVLAQGSYKLLHSIAIDSSAHIFFTTDNQGNIYVVKDDEIMKYNKLGKQLYKFSNKNYGQISAVDASNMMRVLVLYREFSQVLFLDNTLSLNGEPVSFDKLGLQQVSLVSNSFSGGLWAYDQQNTSLLQFDASYQVMQNVGNLSVLLNTVLQPTALIEYDNKVYLNNPSMGILVFDIYGTYYKTIPAKNVSSFQVMRDWIYYLNNGEVKAYNIKTTEDTSFALPEKNVKSFRLEMETLIIQSENKISVYIPE